MNRTVFTPSSAPCSLHDMDALFEISSDTLIMRLPAGMVRIGSPCRQIDGHIEFHGVDWGFCYAYRFDSIGNVGPFTGEKLYLKDFIEKNRGLRLSVADEVYGYRQAKFFGYLPVRDSLQECIVEIYFAGSMIFVEE